MKWVTWALLLLNLGVAGFFVGRGYWPQAESEQNAPLNVDRLSLRSQSASGVFGKSAAVTSGQSANEVPMR